MRTFEEVQRRKQELERLTGGPVFVHVCENCRETVFYANPRAEGLFRGMDAEEIDLMLWEQNRHRCVKCLNLSSR